MNTFAPVSSIMTSNLLTVNPQDTLGDVKAIFDKNNIHHVPVVRYKKLVGLISKSDLDRYTGTFSKNSEDRFISATRLSNTLVEELMTTKLAKLDADDRINVALEVFAVNRFHAIPIVKGEDLVGIITPFDILNVLRDEKPEHPEDVYETTKA